MVGDTDNLYKNQIVYKLEEGSSVDTSEGRVNVLPSNLVTMQMLRGTLLHSDYTAGVASLIERSARYSIFQKNTVMNKSRVVR